MASEEMNFRARLLRRSFDAASLMKGGIALASACAAAAGYLAAGQGGSPAGAAWTSASVFFLASGAGALNNWQDRTADAAMERTRRRPLPAGRVGPVLVLELSCALVAAGAAMLVHMSAGAAAAGLAAVMLYNGIYTPLKTKSRWALVPGITAGAAPAAIGWFAAGGAPTSPVLWYLVVLFGVWQLPHLWIITIKWRRDFASPGVYGFVAEMGHWRVSRLLFLWVLGLAVLMMYAPLFGAVRSGLAAGLILANALFLVFYFVSAASENELTSSRFVLLNGSLMAHIGIITVSNVL